MEPFILNQLQVLDADLRHAFIHFGVRRTRLAYARDVALHICQKYRHTQIGKPLCQALQRDGFTRSSGAGNEPVSIGVARIEFYLAGVVAADEDSIRHAVLSLQ